MIELKRELFEHLNLIIPITSDDNSEIKELIKQADTVNKSIADFLGGNISVEDYFDMVEDCIGLSEIDDYSDSALDSFEQSVFAKILLGQ